MASLLVVVHDKINPDFYKDCQCYKRGDVVDVHPDDWVYGRLELTDPLFRIFIIPALSESEASAYLFWEVPTDPQNPSRTLQRRGFCLDLDSPIIPAAVRAYIDDDTRAQPTFTVTLNQAQLRNLKKLRPPIADPNVIV